MSGNMYIIVFFVLWIIFYLLLQYIRDWIYYSGDQALDELGKNQFRQDIKASKRPGICLAITIFCAIIFLWNKSTLHLVVGIITGALSVYFYLFSKSVQSAMWLKDAIKYAKKNDIKNMIKCAKISNKHKGNTTAEYLLANKDVEGLIEIPSNENNSTNENNKTYEDYLESCKYTKFKGETEDFTVLDFETSGLDPTESEILQIGAVKYRNNEMIKKFVSYVNPHINIPSNITKITGISNKTVEDAPEIYVILPKLIEFIGDDIIIAHNANFDMKFLLHNMYLCRINYRKYEVIDTLALARKYITTTENHKLETLKEYINIDIQSHDAYHDCVVCGELYKKIKTIKNEQATEEAVNIK